MSGGVTVKSSAQNDWIMRDTKIKINLVIREKRILPNSASLYFGGMHFLWQAPKKYLN